jgi:hypothetical protein
MSLLGEEGKRVAGGVIEAELSTAGPLLARLGQWQVPSRDDGTVAVIDVIDLGVQRRSGFRGPPYS